jgi:hypothetical protein
MIAIKDLHMQETVKAAVYYIEHGRYFAELASSFNQLCEDWHANEFNPDELSLDVNDIARHIEDEPWIRNIAAMPAHERTWQMNVRVVEEFIAKYWTMPKDEITTKNVGDVLRVADPLSRRHILAQRVVIECIHDLKTEAQLRRLDKIMDHLATNPRLEEEYF